MALSTILETGVPANAKDKHLSQDSHLLGETGILQALKVGTTLDGYMEKKPGIVPSAAPGEERSRICFVLLHFVFISKVPLEPQKIYIYQTKTPACKNKDPGGTDVSSAYWSYQARIETPSTFSGNRKGRTQTSAELNHLHLSPPLTSSPMSFLP